MTTANHFLMTRVCAWLPNITTGLLYVFLSLTVSCQELYYDDDMSPPTRAALMMLDICSVKYKKVPINLENKENLTPEFLKLNPEHTVPVLKDTNDIIVYGRHNILMYLANKHKKTFYPMISNERSFVNQRLQLDTYFMFYYEYKVVAHNTTTECFKLLCDKQKNKVLRAYDLIETYLKRNVYLASNDSVTIADLAIITHVTTLRELIALDAEKHHSTIKWVNSMQSQPYMKQHNAAGAAKLASEMREVFKAC